MVFETTAYADSAIKPTSLLDHKKSLTEDPSFPLPLLESAHFGVKPNLADNHSSAHAQALRDLYAFRLRFDFLCCQWLLLDRAGSPFRVHVDQHALCGLALAAVARHRKFTPAGARASGRFLLHVEPEANSRGRQLK
jgi:hypothetical protein